MEFNYDKLVKQRKKIAKIIFDNPFMTGLPKLKRKDLYEIIFVLADAYTEKINEMFFELDAKDIAFDTKCNICHLLDEEFFNKDKKGE